MCEKIHPYCVFFWNGAEFSVIRGAQDIVSEVPQLEKDLNIPLQLKTTLIQQFTDSAPFIFYDTYMRACVQKEFSDAKKKVSDCVHKLNNLRPDWAIEEKIEFPDETSWKIHQLGLDKKPQSKNWVRVACVAFGIILIILSVITILRKRKMPSDKSIE
jgi:hypothetical protein